MRILYDGQADALSLILEEAELHSSSELAPGVIVNLDRQGKAVAIEVLGARARIGKAALSQITIDLQDL